ncbi:MAG: cob(I)yrinic acid a,c-diamide adenosyltransferase [Pseudomonadales bacterium]
MASNKRRITRVTTKRGDAGRTFLADGSEVSKNDPRIEAIGTVDELNSFIGVLINTLAQSPKAAPLIEQCQEVQQSLFDLGAALALPGSERFPDLQLLESNSAELNSALPPLTEFVLPGGNAMSAAAHVCRTVCRRAERRLWLLPDDTQAGATYLNRLSDYFFILARTVNQEGGAEAQWRGPTTT